MAAATDYAPAHIRNLDTSIDPHFDLSPENLKKTVADRKPIDLARAPSASDQEEMDIFAIAEWFSSVSLRTLRHVFRGITESEGYTGISALELAERAADWGFDRIHPEHDEPPAAPAPAPVPAIYEGKH